MSESTQKQHKTRLFPAWPSLKLLPTTLLGLTLAFGLGLALQGCTAQTRPRVSAGRSIPDPLEFYTMYELDFPVRHRSTSYLSCSPVGSSMDLPYQVAVHEFHPLGPTNAGTVVIVHGYLSHAGHLSYLIRRLVEHEYAVLAMDLPGHGLSSGRPGGIDDFGEYARCLQAVHRYGVEESFPTPYFGIGFSTGGSAFLELLRQGYGAEYSRIVLASPLVRFRGYPVLPPLTAAFRQVVPQIPTDDSDPLAARTMPLSWVVAANRYAVRLERARPNPAEVLILQGNDDDIVAWRHNLSVLESFLPNAKVRVVTDGRHELYRRRANRGEAFMRTLVFFEYGDLVLASDGSQ